MSNVGTENSLATRMPAEDPGVARLRQAASRLVGSVFYGTLLKIQRESVLQGPYGHGGRGEEVFRAQLDQHLAEQAGQSQRFNLAKAIVARYADHALGFGAITAGEGDEQ